MWFLDVAAQFSWQLPWLPSPSAPSYLHFSVTETLRQLLEGKKAYRWVTERPAMTPACLLLLLLLDMLDSLSAHLIGHQGATSHQEDAEVPVIKAEQV